MRLCSTARIHRSISGRSAGAGAPRRSSTVRCSAAAYVVKNEWAFQYGSITFGTTSRTPRSEKRRGCALTSAPVLQVGPQRIRAGDLDQELKPRSGSRQPLRVRPTVTVNPPIHDAVGEWGAVEQ